MDTPVPDADWLYRCTVRLVPVGDIRIGYLRSAVDRDQSTDAAPVTESQVLYTILRLYKYCAAGYAGLGINEKGGEARVYTGTTDAV